MTLFEALKINRTSLEVLQQLGGRHNDVRYIDMYSEFSMMEKAGFKKTYIVALLSDKYSVCERKVYDVIKRFSRDCTLNAT